MNVKYILYRCVWLLVTLSLTSCRRRRHSKQHHTSGDIKLVGGETPNQGTILIYHRHKWGAICDRDWDLKDADVVCRQLGYMEASKVAYRSEFGKGYNRKWMSSIRCSGYEDMLKYCAFLGWGRMARGCYGSRHSAGVVCRPHPTTTLRTTTTAAPTTIPPKAITDKLSLKRHDIYSRERDMKKRQRFTALSMPQNDAPAILTSGSPATEHGQQPAIEHGQHSDTGSNLLLNTTEHGPHPASEHGPQIGNGTVLSSQGLQVRMVGGRYDWEGRLEVKDEHSEWGTICGKLWTLRETIVVCREIGQEYAKQALQVNYFGGEDLDKHYYQIKCKGTEQRLDECTKIRTNNGVVCSKPNLVAGVVCTHRLPDLVIDLEMLEESVRLTDRPLYYLTCSMEENCLAESAYVIRNTSKNWHANSRRLLRFSTVVHNVGLEDFRPFRAKSQWDWHACHMHYHSMEVFSHYDIIDEHGNRLGEGMKASFCLEDSACQDGIVPKFDCTGYRDQGLSVNCSDNYMYDIDCQWIDITDIKPGEYKFKMEVNPELKVAELDYGNNVASCDLWYSGYNARIHNCVYQSLLSD